MVQITIKDILNVLDEAKKRNIVLFGRNDNLTFEDFFKNHLFGDYRYLYWCFEPSINGDRTLDENHVDSYFENGEHILIIGSYYQLFYKVFGVEPFDFAKELFDYLEIGGEYGLWGEPFDICTWKQLSNDGTITVKLIFCDSNGVLPIFHDERTKTFNINVRNDGFMETIISFNDFFKYKNQKHYPSYYDDEKLDIFQATEKVIEKNQKALEILRRIKRMN